ncbi:MAG: metal-dependent transcriptional regulator [Chloroflexota bacterium]|nr:metal-dependent transcriptional regulator [Chloroflexota bacterium]
MSEHGMQSESVENFLKAVYSLQQGNDRVSTNTLSEVLNRTAPSVTDMAQRLESAGLIDYQKYRGVILTVNGREIALRIIRRHRLIELYLTRELGYALHEVHDEAERLEHAVSERFVEALSHKLGEPQIDPHGDPIPAPDGTVIQRDLVLLTDLHPGVTGQIARIKTSDPQMIRHMLERGLTLEAHIEMISCDPFEGPVRVLTDGAERVIGFTVASCVYVETDP